MKFSKFLAAFLAAVTVLSTAQVSFAASFSERKIALVYTKIVRLTDKKVGKIRNISVANRQKITAARSNLEKSFVSFDAVFRKTPDERTRAGRALVRAYSDLNALIASVAKAPSATSQAVVSASVSEAPKASSAEVAASLSQTADVLYYADAFQDFSTSSGDRFSQSAYSAARCEIQLGRLIQVAYGPRSVIVKANDRPNCTKHPDIVDLSTAAFQSLAPLSKGRLAGSFEVL